MSSATIFAPDTIFALATPAGKSGVAVFRLSGPRAGEVLETLTNRALPEPRLAVKRRLFAPKKPPHPNPSPQRGEGLMAMRNESSLAPRSGERAGGEGYIPLDDALVLWFPAPASFTGEDVAELQVHGGPAIIAAIAAALTNLGLRLAAPGEFTRRAFDHGKLDLVEIEGLADLIAAETEAQRRQALRQAEGALSALYEAWRGALISALARIEAAIDFPDEDLPEGLMELVDDAIAVTRRGIDAHLSDRHRGEMLRDGLSVAILGAPNVGKSSLLNRLAGREAAIVSARAGTTRDVIEVKLDLDGYPVLIADTAGLRESADEIEQEGMRRALSRAEHADLRIVVFDASHHFPLPSGGGRGGGDATGGAGMPPTHLPPEGGRPVVPYDPAAASQIDAEAIVVLNKAEIAALPPDLQVGGRPAIPVSAKTGDGIEALVAAVTAKAAGYLSPGAAPALTRLRHREALERCREALDRGLDAPVVELKAEDLRLAVQALGRITGRVEVDDVLDLIFREFCIGK